MDTQESNEVGGAGAARIDVEAVFSAFTSLVFLLDREERFLDFWAGRGAGPFVPPEQFLGRTVREVLPEPAAGQLLSTLELAFASGRTQLLEYELPGPRGPEWYEGRFLPVPGGHIAVVVEQITARREAERRLQDSEACYRLLFESNPHPMWVYDLETLRFLAVNDAAVRHYGFTREEFLGMTIKEIRPPEDVQRLLANVAAVREGLDTAGIWRHRTKDGSVIDVEITSHTLTFAGRAAELVLAHDVTAQRRLEQQLRHAQKMEAVGRLAGGVAHDFNNLLTAITGFTELALAALPRPSTPGPYLEGVLDAAARAAALTQQLLAFSRKQVLQPREIDLNAVVQGMDRLLRRILGEDVAIETRLAPDLGAVRADSGQLEQVLLNLAVNSRDAMPGGGTLVLETANVELDEDYCRVHHGVAPGSYVLLAVSDNGAGLTAEAREHLFEPFFTTKEVGKGTGLGLSTVYGIVQQSGGFIWGYSETGEGTTFKIYLPRAAQGPSAAVPAEPEVRSGTETILLAEDNSAVREVVTASLRHLGYTVLAAPGPEEALALARAHRDPPDLLVTDVVMPGMSGPELARRLLELRPGCRVLYASGYTPNAIVHHGVLKEGIWFLQKPFGPETLARKVRQILDAPR